MSLWSDITQPFFDPFGLLSGSSPPAAPGIPNPPNYRVSYKGRPTTRTNFGSFDTASMMVSPDELHPSVHKNGTFPTTPPPVQTRPPNPPTHDPGQPNPPGNPPVHNPPGGPGKPPGSGGFQPQSQIFSPVSATASYAKQYAQTPNTVVTSSGMSVPTLPANNAMPAITPRAPLLAPT